MTTAKYEIAGSDYRCGSCSQELECCAPYFSAIFFAEGEFRRRDYCVTCWSGTTPPAPQETVAPLSGEAAPGKPAGMDSRRPFAFWRTRRPPLPSAAPKKMRFDCDLVLQLFRGLQQAAPEPGHGGQTQADGEGQREASAESSETQELGFVLALLLIRKKVLTLQSTAEKDGSEWLKIGERGAPKSSFWIRNPELKPSQLDRLKVRIGELLQMHV
jgi:hypothetical protein